MAAIDIPDWSSVDPKLREAVIDELHTCKWEAAHTNRELALAFAAAANELSSLPK